MASSTVSVVGTHTRTAARTCVDVTDVPTGEVRAYARTLSDRAHLERRGGRTYLVARDA
jgi:hypothetical protein